MSTLKHFCSFHHGRGTFDPPYEISVEDDGTDFLPSNEVRSTGTRFISPIGRHYCQHTRSLAEVASPSLI